PASAGSSIPSPTRSGWIPTSTAASSSWSPRPALAARSRRRRDVILGSTVTEPIVFATQAYDSLGRAVAAATGWELGSVTRRTFPDGEHSLRIESDPADRDVVLVGGTIDDASTLELYDLACGMVTAGAYRLRIV